jgi:2-isopropylmalate synthase
VDPADVGRGYEERAMGSSTRGGDARACAFLEVAPTGGGQERFGVGMDDNIVTASIKALVGTAARSTGNTQPIAVSQVR